MYLVFFRARPNFSRVVAASEYPRRGRGVAATRPLRAARAHGQLRVRDGEDELDLPALEHARDAAHAPELEELEEADGAEAREDAAAGSKDDHLLIPKQSAGRPCETACAPRARPRPRRCRKRGPVPDVTAVVREARRRGTVPTRRAAARLDAAGPLVLSISSRPLALARSSTDYTLGVAATLLHGTSMRSPRRRRDPPPRNIHATPRGGARLHGISTRHPAAAPRYAPTEYPRGTRGGAAARLHEISTRHPRRGRGTPHFWFPPGASRPRETSRRSRRGTTTGGSASR